MTQVQLATRIDERVKQAVEKRCRSRGLEMNRFIEEARLDKLEELEDVEELTQDVAVRADQTADRDPRGARARWQALARILREAP